jgi:hypothetical protein
MGGGKKSFNANNSSVTSKHFLDKHLCVRTDGKDLIKEWIEDKTSKNLSYQYLTNEKDMKSLDTENTEYILGEWLPIIVLYVLFILHECINQLLKQTLIIVLTYV